MSAAGTRTACWLALIGVQAVSCGQTAEPDTTGVDGGARDASPTLSSDGTCDLAKPYRSRYSGEGVYHATEEAGKDAIPFVDPTLTDDELTLFVHEGPRVYVSRREDLRGKFLEFVRLRGFESLDGIASLSVSGDGRRLYFVSTLKREFPNFDRDPRLRRAVRDGDTNVYVMDAAPVLEDPMERAAVAAHEGTVFFVQAGDNGLYERTRTPEGWRSARLVVKLGGLGAASADGNGVLPFDGMLRRAGPDEPFRFVEEVLAFQSSMLLHGFEQHVSWLGGSGCRIYFTESQDGRVRPVILYTQRPL